MSLVLESIKKRSDEAFDKGLFVGFVVGIIVTVLILCPLTRS